jgi:hypothetical protein
MNGKNMLKNHTNEKKCNNVVMESMKIKNIRLKSIEARRYMRHHERPRQISINHNSSITQISDIKEKQATVVFQYTASYGPVGMIKLEGSMIYEDDKAKKIANEWKNTRKIPNQIASRIYSAVMHTSVPEAVGIAKDLGLPPPIPMPQVKLGEKPNKGQIGPELA